MRFYTYGYRNRPELLLIPGTCCHHSMFDGVVPMLTERFYVIVASFTGFDENEAKDYDAVYTDMDTETEAIERFVRDRLEGHIACCYGSSLGGSFAAYLLQRKKIRIDHVILGSSDLDYAEPASARFQAELVTRLLYDALRKGKPPGWMAAVNALKCRLHPEQAEYREKFTACVFTPALCGGTVKRESIYNQFYSDLVTRLEADIYRKGTAVHVFYAAKMGKKYLKRYQEHFRAPDIRRQDLLHEELLLCRPRRWTDEVLACCGLRSSDLDREEEGSQD